MSYLEIGGLVTGLLEFCRLRGMATPDRFNAAECLKSSMACQKGFMRCSRS
jgi:hypothetical protein